MGLPACGLLRGKTAIITGGVTGIGRAITLEFLRQGCNVAVNHLGLQRDEHLKKGLLEEARRLGTGDLVELAGDVAKPETSQQLVSKAVDRWGKLDICVANAGVFKPTKFLEIEQDVYQQSMRVNVDGTFNTCQAAARQMVAQGHGGSIIATSSVSALVGGGQQVHYTPTKAAVYSMMQSMAIALGQHKIRCNALMPGTIRTQLSDHETKDPAKMSYLEGRIPLGRVGDPEDMAGPAVFLACGEFSGVTCRQRHLKCDERTPSCGPCIKSGHACFYGNGTAAQAHTSRQPAAVTDEHPTPPSPNDACLAAISPAVSQSNVVDPDSTLAGAAAGDSPGSTVSSSRPAIGTATAGWFGLLLDDAALELGHDDSSAFYPLDPGLFARDASSASQRLSILSPAQANSISEHGLWQCSERIQLSTNECLLFENFVRRVSCWLDLFDPDDNFSTLVPRLAMYNTGLMNAILALSVRHISLNPSVAPDTSHERADALKYYYETLHYLHKAMQYDSFKTSLELLATSLIVSTYEMLDGSRQDWERHLKGVFWIQRSQLIHGDTGGLKQAIWWAWLCQDVWAAFREKRKVLTFWKHPRTFDQLNEHELACRAIFTFSKAVNFCSMEEVEADKDDVAGRIAKSESLINMLDEWQSLLTIRFSPLPVDTSTSDVFTPIWIQPSSFVFSAGLCVQDTKQREAILELIKKCRNRTGWPIKPLEDELQTLWTIH
ncbi:hypothetical protein SLS56_009872 [Neofusicoccum ribis]|uniref:Zn(2)-C6 fungal-type domain-containing protein n=1 Tax=Neofusicoccum ribis TaxID=45134 RepID=A0ABR3SFZ1_9PEZI